MNSDEQKLAFNLCCATDIGTALQLKSNDVHLSMRCVREGGPLFKMACVEHEFHWTIPNHYQAISMGQESFLDNMKVFCCSRTFDFLLERVSFCYTR